MQWKPLLIRVPPGLNMNRVGSNRKPKDLLILGNDIGRNSRNSNGNHLQCFPIDPEMNSTVYLATGFFDPI